MATTEQTTLGDRDNSVAGNGGDEPTRIVTNDDGEQQCPYCNEWFSRISNHWTQGSCDWPPISQYKKELLTGLMLGDGNINRRDRQKNTFRLQLSTLPYIQFVTDELAWVSGNINMQQTAKGSAKACREGLGIESGPEDCHDYYNVSCITHPWISDEFTPWYETGEIVFPADIDITPTVVRAWYVTDGGLHSGNNYIQFGSANEAERPETMRSLLEQTGVSVSVDETTSQGKRAFRIPASDTPDFLDYCGSPPPGFAYKWCYDDRDRYDELKQYHDEVCMTQTFTDEVPDDWQARHPTHWTDDGQPKYEDHWLEL